MRKRVQGQQMSYQNMAKLTQKIPHMLGEVHGLEEPVCMSRFMRKHAFAYEKAKGQIS